MNSTFMTFWQSAHSMLDRFIARLPSLIVGVIVFLLFYVLRAHFLLRGTPMSWNASLPCCPVCDRQILENLPRPETIH